MFWAVNLVTMTLVFFGAILDKWLEIFTQAFASSSFAQELGPIGLSVPFTSTHVMTSSGWIISQYSMSGGTSTVSLLGAISGVPEKYNTILLEEKKESRNRRLERYHYSSRIQDRNSK